VRHIGVDGCTGGWIAVSKDDGELTYRIAKTASEVLRAFPSAERVLIDVPIGLPWRDVPIRPCDRLARTILGDRRSSVFSVPCRASVRADAIEAARELNKGELGRSLSEQSWGICRQIREVDDLLLGTPRHRAEVREIHPEVCFWALAGCSPMKHNKRQKEGFRERLAVLAAFEPHAACFVDFVLAEEPRSKVSADDVLDALAAFVTSSAADSQLASICGVRQMMNVDSRWRCCMSSGIRV
jgi:predicted RNase H-like nuclease